MSERKLITAIHKELESLNDLIDTKVIEGLSYKREAKRHRLLLKMLKEAREHEYNSRPVFNIGSFIF